MLHKYAHSAFTYASDWLWYDRPAIAVLSCDSPEPPDDDKARQALCKFAQQYGVIRNFKTIHDEGPRLAKAWQALQKIQKPATNDHDAAKRQVEELARLLENAYKQNAWSAASKFLWIRFRCPIIIYDTLAWGWMNRQKKCGSIADWKNQYNAFYNVWRDEYETCRREIREACEGLLDVRDYLPPIAISNGEFVPVPLVELEQAVSSEWFLERVFDHYMLNAESYSRIGTHGGK